MARMSVAVAVLLHAVACAPSAQTPRTEAWVDPARGAADNPGTRERPWRTLGEAAAQGRLAELAKGATVWLRGGDHGTAKLQASSLTISAWEGSRPYLGRLEISGEDLTLRRLEIGAEFADTYRGPVVTIAERKAGKNITLEGCFVHTARDASEWTAEHWRSAKPGILCGRRGSHITLRDNYVLHTRFAIEVNAPNSTCEGNVVDGYSGDGFRITRDDITLRYNVIRNCYLSDKHGDKNHDDAIQCFLFNKGTGTVRRVTVESNLILSREADDQPFLSHPQAIGFFDGPLVDFVVRDNVCLVDHWHGVSLYDAQGCTIVDNACYSRWPGKMKPWVRLGKKKHTPKGNIVRDNFAHSIHLEEDAAVKASGNAKVTERAFWARYRQVAKAIEKKFGKTHDLAGLERVRWWPEE